MDSDEPGARGVTAAPADRPLDPGRSLWRILLLLGLWYAGSFALPFALSALGGRSLLSGPSFGWVFLAMLGVDYALLALVLLWMLGRGAAGWLVARFRRCRVRWYLASLAAVAAIYLLNGLVLLPLLSRLLGIDLSAWWRAHQGVYAFLGVEGGGWLLPLALLVLALVAPALEECLFRAVLFGRLRRSLAFPLSAVISAALFSAIHLDVMNAPAIFLLGVAFAWLYERSGSLGPSVAAHVANNAFFTLVMAFLTGGG